MTFGAHVHVSRTESCGIFGDFLHFHQATAPV